MGDGVVTKAEFHNTLRILLGIDGDEFVTAVYGRQASDDDILGAPSRRPRLARLGQIPRQSVGLVYPGVG
jgi:hypothetical protein